MAPVEVPDSIRSCGQLMSGLQPSSVFESHQRSSNDQTLDASSVNCDSDIRAERVHSHGSTSCYVYSKID